MMSRFLPRGAQRKPGMKKNLGVLRVVRG